MCRVRSSFGHFVTHDTGISAVSREDRCNLGDAGNVLFLADRAVAGARGSRVLQRGAGSFRGLKSGIHSTGVVIPRDLVVRGEATIIIIGNLQAAG